MRTNGMACYTASEVVQLLEEDTNTSDMICMDGSDDELGFEEVEVGGVADIEGSEKMHEYTYSSTTITARR